MRLRLLFLFILAVAIALSAIAQSPPTSKTAPALRLIPVPSKLADEYAKALDAEVAALNAATQTPQYKDYQTAQQQRLRIETFIAGEVGCKPSASKIIREANGQIVVNKEGRIEKIECSDAKE